MPDGKSEVAEYYKIAPVIASRINILPNAKEIWKDIFSELIIPEIGFIEAQEDEKAFSLYKGHTLALSKKYI